MIQRCTPFSRRGLLRAGGTLGLAAAAGAALPGIATADTNSVDTAGGPAIPAVIDDFTTGPFAGTFTSLSGERRYQSGASIMGGARLTRFRHLANSRTPVTLRLGNGRFGLATGGDQAVRVEFGYGERAPLDLDLTQLGARAFRTSFEYADGPFFHHITLCSAAGDRAYFTESLAASERPFTHDTLITGFPGHAVAGNSKVSAVVLVLQADDDLAISAFELV